MLEVSPRIQSFPGHKLENEATSMTLESAMQRMSFKDFKGALTCFHQLQNSFPENPMVMYQMGLCQVHLRMFQEAENSFLRSNTPQALYSCFELYLRQEKLEPALNVLKRSQSIDALLELIRIQNDQTHPLHKFKESIDIGKVKCLLGTRYLLGEDGLQVNESRALQLYKESVDIGYSSGFTGLAYMYEHGIGGLEPNFDEAIRLYKEGAERGCVRAMGNLGNCLLESKNANEEEAVKWLTKAAKEGDTDSMTILGLYYTKKQDIVNTKNSSLEVTSSNNTPEKNSKVEPAVANSGIELEYKRISRKSPHRTNSSPISNLGSVTTSPIQDKHNYNLSSMASPVTLKDVLQCSSIHESILSDSESESDQQSSRETGSSKNAKKLQIRLEEDETSPLKNKKENIDSRKSYEDIVHMLEKPKSELRVKIAEEKNVEDVPTHLDDVSITIRPNVAVDATTDLSTILNHESKGLHHHIHSTLAFNIITNSIIFSTNLLGHFFSLGGIVAAVCLFTLYAKDIRYIYCMASVILSFFIHVLGLFSSIVCYIILRSKRGKLISFLNFIISFASVVATFSFASGLAIILTLLHLNGIIVLTAFG